MSEMLKAEDYISLVRQRGSEGKTLERVFRNMLNPELFRNAYGKLYQNDTEIRGLWQYYQYALNASKDIYYIRYMAERALVATLCHKLRTKKTTVYRRYSYVGKRKCLGIKTEKGTQITFGNFTLHRSNFREITPIYDRVFKEYYGRRQVVTRLEKGICEIDGCKNPGEEVHHIRAMKDLNKWKKRGVTPPTWVKSMMAMYRKTLVVCKSHHLEIHRGKLS